MSNRRRAIASLVLLVVGAVMFELPGAWLFARGAPWWTALAVGLLVFPVVPLGWHLLGERKRKRGLAAAAASAKPGLKPKASTLTGGDRFKMRLVAVALIALGPLLFFRGRATWRAVKAHPAWFVPHAPPGPPSFHGDARMMAQVPADAELVIWARRLDAMTVEDKAGSADDAKEVLIAYRAGAVLMVARGSSKALGKLDLAEMNAQLGKQHVIPIDGPLVARRRSSDLLVVVSEGWAQAADDRNAGRTGGPDAIAARLAAAPDDAVIITAAAPAHPVAGLSLTGMQSWLRISKLAIRIDAEFSVPDRAAGDALIARMEAERRELTAAVPDECRPKIEGALRDIVIAGGESTVRMSVWWKPEQVGKAMMCGLGVMMKNADWK